MAIVNLPAELAEVTSPLQAEDELLNAAELASLEIFEEIKKDAGSLAKFPGTTVLRKCEKGRVLVRQGDAGATAYYILSSEDALELRQLQIATLEKLVAAKSAKPPQSTDGIHQYLEDLPLKDLQAKLAACRSDADALTRRIAAVKDKLPKERHVVTAHLLLSQSAPQKKGLLHRLFGSPTKKPKNPEFIPVDGPSDISAKTKQAPLHEGEIFGEMSCMNRAPRSATVVAHEDCYLLEMLRNVLDQLHKDPAYKKKMDAVYRERVLDGHVRRLPLFQDLPDDEFARVRDRIELVDFEAGAVVFEEHDDPDSFYVVRSGLVKVVKNAWTLPRLDEFKPSHWQSIWKELAEGADDDLISQVWGRMPDDLQAAAKDAEKTPPGSDQQKSLLEVMDGFVRNGGLHTALGKTTEEVIQFIEDPQVAVDCEQFPDDTGKWSELEARTFHRSLLEALLPLGMPRRAETSGARRILRYMGRGEGFGELGVITGERRSATIFAYDHPDGGANQKIPDSRMGAVPSRVELVKIKREDFVSIVNASPKLKSKVDVIVSGYQQQAQKRMAAVGDRVEVRSQSPEFEQLGLIQGQRLMLIDLDRCTRCGQCVDACVSAHDDGRTRLYLDGPRFEKYLVPLTCRSCLDPVCMIGCPVGSINRGDNGEIQIRDWCIGCSMCADQCPYGSIQMSVSPGVELSESQKAAIGDAELKSVSEQAVVCDLCSSLPSRQPSCVYACPHDAAMRVNALEFFFELN